MSINFLKFFQTLNEFKLKLGTIAPFIKSFISKIQSFKFPEKSPYNLEPLVTSSLVKKISATTGSSWLTRCYEAFKTADVYKGHLIGSGISLDSLMEFRELVAKMKEFNISLQPLEVIPTNKGYSSPSGVIVGQNPTGKADVVASHALATNAKKNSIMNRVNSSSFNCMHRQSSLVCGSRPLIGDSDSENQYQIHYFFSLLA